MRSRLFIAIGIAVASWPLGFWTQEIARAGSDYMVLTTADYEAGISYRAVQSHAPIGLITNPCSYVDNFAATARNSGNSTGERRW
jgi:hypothetical protein